MKKYYVTVNGVRYEVEVEEVKGNFTQSTIPSPPLKVETRYEEKTYVPEQKIEPEKETPKPVSPNGEQGEAIECPMPGTILKVAVSDGALVKKGDLLFVLEAMKMENEIMSPKDGKIVKVKAEKGSLVNSGDVLALIK